MPDISRLFWRASYKCPGKIAATWTLLTMKNGAKKPDMPHSKALASLRAAILEERMARPDAQKVLNRYNDFTAKLTEFQTSEGPSPTREEFEVWRSDMLLVWAVREEQLKAECAQTDSPLDRPQDANS